MPERTNEPAARIDEGLNHTSDDAVSRWQVRLDQAYATILAGFPKGRADKAFFEAGAELQMHVRSLAHHLCEHSANVRTERRREAAATLTNNLATLVLRRGQQVLGTATSSRPCEAGLVPFWCGSDPIQRCGRACCGLARSRSAPLGSFQALVARCQG